jgi:hypothetical protein
MKKESEKSEDFILSSFQDDHEEEYRKFCLSLSPEDRFKLGIELSEWAMLFNKRIDILLEERLKDGFILK